MPCSACGQSAPSPQDPIRMAEIRVDDDGIYRLASDTECSGPYRGAFQGATVYVVDMLGDNPQVYRRGERVTAATVARMEGKTLNHVNVNEMCHETVLAVFGA